MKRIGWFGRAMFASAAGTFILLNCWDFDRRMPVRIFHHPSDIFMNGEAATWTCIYLFPFFFLVVAVYALMSHVLGAIHDSETRCRKCHYILRGISEPRCPECGETI